jgi:hypothetical protein
LPRYEVWLRIDPPRFFGLPEEGVDVVPAGINPVFHGDFNTGRGWITLEDGSDPRRAEGDRLQTEFKMNGAIVRADDNIFRVSLDAPTSEEAIARSQNEIQRLVHLLTTFFPGPATSMSATPFRVTLDGLERHKQPEVFGRLYVYDIEHMKAELLRAAALLNGMVDDPRLTMSLRYFALGDDLAELQRGWATDEDLIRLMPVRFLQYWKALATIVGDPSRDPDHQSRPKGLGLGRQFFRHQVAPLHNLRNSFGVAHIADPDASAIVSPVDVDKCRDVAAQAIVAYIRARGGVVITKSGAAIKS